LFFEWWNTEHLMQKLNEKNLTWKLKDILKDKVYVWVSAWSMVTNPDLWIKLFEELYEEDSILENNIKWLNFVDFYVLPHLNNNFFTKVKKENIDKIYKNFNKKIYVLDDNSALKIVDNDVEIISEWKFLVYN
jgi:dipeptidase E